MKEFEYHNRIMGCDLDISVVTASHLDPQSIFDLCYKELKKYESIFSRFDDTSELSVLNKKKELCVSDIFFEVFLEARKLYFESGGVFNPLVQVSQFGYTKDFSHKDNFKKLKTIDYDDNFSHIEIDFDTQCIQLKNNQKLDFGGFLKGYLSQKVSSYLNHFHGSIINIGGDIYAQGLDEYNNNFVFTVFNPVNEKSLPSVVLNSQSLSTSGTYKRKWKDQNGTISHIIDTQTKESVSSDIISASIISKDGGLSDALATSCIVLGSKKSIEFLKPKNVQYILITYNGDIITNLHIK